MEIQNPVAMFFERNQSVQIVEVMQSICIQLGAKKAPADKISCNAFIKENIKSKDVSDFYSHIDRIAKRNKSTDARKSPIYRYICNYIYDIEGPKSESIFEKTLLKDYDNKLTEFIGPWHECKYSFVRKTPRNEGEELGEFPSWKLRRSIWNFYLDKETLRLRVRIYSSKNDWRGQCKTLGEHLYVVVDEGDERNQQGFTILKRPSRLTEETMMVGISLGVGASDAERPTFPIMAGRSALVRMKGPIRYSFLENDLEITPEERMEYCNYLTIEEYRETKKGSVEALKYLDEDVKVDRLGSRLTFR